MSLRGHPVEEPVTLPDGRVGLVRIGVPEDPYIRKRELDTVAAEVLVDGVVSATVVTLLRPRDNSEARRLAAEIAAGLESGELEPTAGSIEPLALRAP